jgi:hypothetical protein
VTGLENSLGGRVVSCIYQVDHYLVKIHTGINEDLNFSVQSPLTEGDQVTLSIRQEALLWYEANI